MPTYPFNKQCCSLEDSEFLKFLVKTFEISEFESKSFWKKFLKEISENFEISLKSNSFWKKF